MLTGADFCWRTISLLFEVVLPEIASARAVTKSEEDYLVKGARGPGDTGGAKGQKFWDDMHRYGRFV